MKMFAEYIKKYFKGTKVGDWIINFIRIRGIDEMLLSGSVKKQYKKDMFSPTEQMRTSKQYFNEHQRQIECIVGFLADDESRMTYRKAIEYRYTHNMDEMPKYTKNIYFPEDIIHLSEDEVFVDAGAFVGDTIRKFYKLTHGRYKKIIAFEPDTYNYQCLTKLKYRDVITKNMGLWDNVCELSFTNGGGCGSKVSEDAVDAIKVTRLDDVKTCRDATYIKMDIEGAESRALKGAENIIKNNHPKLAICLYHSDEDMIRIL